MAKQLADKILEYLADHDKVNSLDLVNIFNEDHQKIIGAIKSLETVGDLLTVTPLSQKKWVLTPEGTHVVQYGSHEAAVYKSIPDDGLPQLEIMKSVPNAKVGLSKALVAGWIEIDKSNNVPVVRKKVQSIVDNIQNDLRDIEGIPDDVKAEYKKRKLLQEITIKSILLEKGSKFSIKLEKLEADLTADLLVNGAWKEKKFKPYNFDALGSALEIGHLHPLLKVKAEFRKIFIEMGFTEMPTNNFVESSFWNFDALFQPQQHPARDAHDTFFISEPSTSTVFPMEYLERVKKVHSKGGYGSQGYKYDWKIEEAQKNVLRTHTTACSARMLYTLMQEGEFKPVKYFSIDRVFRNETLDATHLAEFHQVEGVVADYNLTLGDLIGILYEFFKKLGITQLQFKPAYNPYTEPSMEVFCYHNGLEKWIEIGNSGMFRPEMLLPLGLPENVNVIAWGLSLERPTMIKYALNNIRDLVGPRVDMEMVHNNPICRLDKNTRVSLKKQAGDPKEINGCVNAQEVGEINMNSTVKGRINRIKKENLIIFCDPNYPLYSLDKLLYLVKPYMNVQISTYVHSSVICFPKELIDFYAEFQPNGLEPDLSLTLIWKIVGVDPIMELSSVRKIAGEVNIIKYINRLIELKNSNALIYESGGILYANRIDSYLEQIHGILHGDENKFNIKEKLIYVMGNNISIVDILLLTLDKRGLE